MAEVYVAPVSPEDTTRNVLEAGVARLVSQGYSPVQINNALMKNYLDRSVTEQYESMRRRYTQEAIRLSELIMGLWGCKDKG